MTRHFELKRNFTQKLMGLVACLLLASCTSEPQNIPPANPALWKVTSEGGETEGWLFGTIHQLPDDYNWRTETLETALKQADWLAVEVSDLDNVNSLATTFARLGTTLGQPSLSQRVESKYRRDLAALLDKGSYGDGDFAQTETWAAALTLAQLFSSGKSENGVDRVLIREFVAKIELEGATKQLSIFDALAEDDQRDLLEGIVRESVAAQKADANALADAWISGDLDGLIDEDSDTILSDPELRAALLTNRNLDWTKALKSEMEAKGPIMVAVGAAHMLGDVGLPSLLREQGYTVTRIQ